MTDVDADLVRVVVARRRGFTAAVACQVDVLGYLEGDLARIGTEWILGDCLPLGPVRIAGLLARSDRLPVDLNLCG